MSHLYRRLVAFSVATVALGWMTSVHAVTFNPDGGCSLTTNLTTYWKLDEASGTRLDELTGCGGGGCDLTDNNTVTQGAGIVGDAAQFTAANSESLSRADDADLSISGNQDFTIAAWVYFDTVDANNEIVAKHDGATCEYDLRQISGNIRLGVSSDGSCFSATVSSTETVSTATWYFIVAWHDAAADTINVSVNNGTAASAAHSAGLLDSTQAFFIGARGGPGLFFNGQIDEVGRWSKVLTARERSDLYNGGSGNTYDASGNCSGVGAMLITRGGPGSIGRALAQCDSGFYRWN